MSAAPVRAWAPAPAPAQRKPARDPWFDNAKYALVTLVVIGHMWTLLTDAGAKVWLYDFLYYWHVPAFVIVTGYLSRNFDYTHERLRALFRTVVVPYMLFELVLALFRVYVGHEDINDIWADPHWPMWYLAALFFWRLLTPPFRRLSYAAIPVAVVVSLVAGIRATDWLDLARVLGLLPFFVIGISLRKEHFEVLHRRWVRVAGVVTLALIFAGARFTDAWINTEWLYYRARYDELEPHDLQAILIRLALIVIGTLGAFAFLSLVPPRHTWYTRLGGATLVVYLFHGFVVKSMLYAGLTFGGHENLGLLVLTTVAVGLSTFLSWPSVARVLTKAVDPIGGIISYRRRRGLPPPGDVLPHEVEAPTKEPAP
jgi:fucose 4-O-acetylase-like acetyltransferase